jgi:pimeloyl-ACP methyl ester carboxylesterase
MVPVGGARMHVLCTGSGRTTVLFVAGFTGDHSSFTGIAPRVTDAARVCSYDRFGTGDSDLPPAPQTFATQARDLRAALDVLGEPGPYVVVGHSFGGGVAVSFTSQYPNDVGGVLLLDASPPSWNAAACSVVDDGSAAAEMWVQTCAMQAENIERLDGPAAFTELAAIDSLGDVPMIVVTASDHDYTADGFDPAAATRLTDAWFDGQDHWASLSPNSRLITVDDSGHYVHQDRPDLVIEQIERLLHHSGSTS